MLSEQPLCIQPREYCSHDPWFFLVNWSSEQAVNINPLPPGRGYSRRKNCVSTAGFSAIILGQCSSEHGERKLTLALVYIVIDLCVLSRNEKAKFA